jgi:hypothetical protein
MSKLFALVALALAPLAACNTTDVGGLPADQSDPADTLGIECTSNDDCSADQYCLLRSDHCDARFEYGPRTCELRGDGDEETYAPVCGCDGEVYRNTSEAALNGVNVAKYSNSCATSPEQTRACGALFCELDTYCYDELEGSMSCTPLPSEPGCDTARTCAACFPNDELPSGCTLCTEDGDTLTLDCGGF